jgi:hypothetical protein
MAQVGGMHRGLVGPRQVGEDAAQQRAANVQFPPVCFREGNSGQVQRCQPGFVNRESAQILRHKRPLLQLAAGGCQTLAQVCK